MKSCLTALSRVFVEMLIVVMLVQFIGNRPGSGRYFPLFTKARCRPDYGPLYPMNIHDCRIRFISIFFSYLRPHFQLNFFLDIFQIKCGAYFSLHHLFYVLPSHHHPDLMSLVLFSIQHKLYSSAQSSFHAVYTSI
jgi:hypothetical protein